MGIFDKNANREVLDPEQFKKIDQYSQQGDFSNFDAPFRYGGNANARGAAISDAEARIAAARNRAPILADPAALDRARATELQARANQGQAQQYFSAMARGQGPSVAAPQYRIALNQANQRAAMGADSFRGAGNAGTAQRQAMFAAAGAGGDMAAQYGGVRLGEQLNAARGAMGGAGAMSQADLARAGLGANWAQDQANAAIQQRGANIQDAMYWEGLKQQINQADQTGAIAGYGLMQNLAEAQRQEEATRQARASAKEDQYLKWIAETGLKMMAK